MSRGRSGAPLRITPSRIPKPATGSAKMGYREKIRATRTSSGAPAGSCVGADRFIRYSNYSEVYDQKDVIGSETEVMNRFKKSVKKGPNKLKGTQMTSAGIQTENKEQRRHRRKTTQGEQWRHKRR